MEILMAEAVSDTTRDEQFKSWVRQYSDMLFRHALLRGFDHDTARDLTQDTFIAAWKGMHTFEGKASVKNWLFVILRNKITDHYRKAVNQAGVSISDYDAQFDERGHWAKPFYPRELTINPADAADRAEFNGILQRCAEKLNTVQRAVFVMKYIDDLKSDDICLQLSLSANNYWTLLHRAKVQLRACLEKNWFLIRKV